MADGTIRFLPMVLNEQRATIVEKYKEPWGMRKKYTAITGLDVQQNSISLVSMVREGAWLLQETPNGRFYVNHYALTSQSSSVTFIWVRKIFSWSG